MKANRLGQIFLTYFGLLGLVILFTWVKFIYNVQTLGGEMGDTIFFFLFIPITIYYSIISLWSYRLYKNHQDLNNSTLIQYLLVFLLGVCTSIYLIVLTT